MIEALRAAADPGDAMTGLCIKDLRSVGISGICRFSTLIRILPAARALLGRPYSRLARTQPWRIISQMCMPST
jgi:hypothetical protein